MPYEGSPRLADQPTGQEHARIRGSGPLPLRPQGGKRGHAPDRPGAARLRLRQSARRAPDEAEGAQHRGHNAGPGPRRRHLLRLHIHTDTHGQHARRPHALLRREDKESGRPSVELSCGVHPRRRRGLLHPRLRQRRLVWPRHELAGQLLEQGHLDLLRCDDGLRHPDLPPS